MKTMEEKIPHYRILCPQCGEEFDMADPVAAVMHMESCAYHEELVSMHIPDYQFKKKLLNEV